MKTVIVTGGRYYDDFAMVVDVLDFIKPDLVVQGGAPGADTLAKQWAEASKIQCITVEAEWAKYGKPAGPKRNVKMIEAYPDAIIVAFPGNDGTKNCVKEAVARNRIVLQVHK